MKGLIITVILTFLIFSCQDQKESQDTNRDFLIYKIKKSTNYNDLRLIEDEIKNFEYDTVIRNNLDAISDKYYDLEKFEDYHRVNNTYSVFYFF